MSFGVFCAILLLSDFERFRKSLSMMMEVRIIQKHSINHMFDKSGHFHEIIGVADRMECRCGQFSDSSLSYSDRVVTF